jgi:hypothetical protein
VANIAAYDLTQSEFANDQPSVRNAPFLLSLVPLPLIEAYNCIISIVISFMVIQKRGVLKPAS